MKGTMKQIELLLAFFLRRDGAFRGKFDPQAGLSVVGSLLWLASGISCPVVFTTLSINFTTLMSTASSLCWMQLELLATAIMKKEKENMRTFLSRQPNKLKVEMQTFVFNQRVSRVRRLVRPIIWVARTGGSASGAIRRRPLCGWSKEKEQL
jgi:hypothetical protein